MRDFEGGEHPNVSDARHLWVRKNRGRDGTFRISFARTTIGIVRMAKVTLRRQRAKGIKARKPARQNRHRRESASIMETPRYVPDVPFPPYTFVPRRAPHPYTDPRGHSFGVKPPPAVALDPDDWEASQAYLRGIDLFNHGYYWEAHEAWESAWNGSGRKGPIADFLKALIQLAAAGVKVREAVPAGVRRHAARAAEILRGVCDQVGQRFCGLDMNAVIDFAEAVAAADPRGSVADAGALFDTLLRPDAAQKAGDGPPSAACRG
jgi:hypothetical protein